MTRTRLALAAAAALPATSRATDLTIENYTNGRVLVALAYNHWDGNVVVRGWFAIAANDRQTFSAGDAADLYVHVQDDGGNKITWPGYGKFLNRPVSGEPFTVSKEPDDATVRILQSKSNSGNIRKGDAMRAKYRNNDMWLVPEQDANGNHFYLSPTMGTHALTFN